MGSAHVGLSVQVTVGILEFLCEQQEAIGELLLGLASLKV